MIILYNFCLYFVIAYVVAKTPMALFMTDRPEVKLMKAIVLFLITSLVILTQVHGLTSEDSMFWGGLAGMAFVKSVLLMLIEAGEGKDY